MIIKNKPIANEKNILFFEDYRITVLDSGLIRLEKSKKHSFRDYATQAVLFRDMAEQKYSYSVENGILTLQTELYQFLISNERDNCYVMIDGKKIPMNNSQNLLGTYRTLDNCDGDIIHIDSSSDNSTIIGKVELEMGVCSRNGIAVLDDTNSLPFDFEGHLLYDRYDGSDEYIFVYPNDYRKAIKMLYTITAYPPLIPRFAFGNWWSRYYPYTDKEYIKLMREFERRNVPLTVATIDMDWHYVSEHDLEEDFHIKERGLGGAEYGGTDGWTGYTFNKRFFPEPKQFFDDLHKRNLKATLNLHPRDGLRWFEEGYEQFSTKLGVDPNTKKPLPFEVTEEYQKAYFDTVICQLENKDVDFWWIDWQQGTESSIEGLDPLWVNNHYHTLHCQESGKAPIILSRYCQVGSHRYPLGFSGDTFITYDTLAYLPYFTSTASNIGYTWWSHDIGGHVCGTTDGELYLRFLQFGVFSPINRLHSGNMDSVTKEPWVYKNGIGEIAMNFMRYRHAMIPFLHSLNYKTHKDGIALIEPMYYEYPNQEEAYNATNQYMFGGLIVAPVVTPKDENGFSYTNLWVPKGEWTDIFTQDKYYVDEEEGKYIQMARSLDSIPVLARTGAILTFSKDKGNTVSNPDNLLIDVYAGNGEFDLFEDSEDSSFNAMITHFKVSRKENYLELSIETDGNLNIKNSRNIEVVFKDIENGSIRFNATYSFLILLIIY